jgi:hypothetical protein
MSIALAIARVSSAGEGLQQELQGLSPAKYARQFIATHMRLIAKRLEKNRCTDSSFIVIRNSIRRLEH